jgi:hypothetical protein
MLAFTSLTALLLALGADGLVRVDGTCVCPEPVDVATRLERLLPARPIGIEPDRASIDLEAGLVRLVLARPDGTLVGEKRLDPKASCEEMAEAVAIVIAIWERPLRPGLMPSLPAVESNDDSAGRGSPKVSASGAAAEQVLPSDLTDNGSSAGVEGVERNSDAGRAHGARVARPPLGEEPATSGKRSARSPWRVEAGAAFQAIVPGATPGAILEGIVRRSPAGWGPRVALGAAWWNDASLGAGEVSWTRLTAGVGLIHGWSGSSVFLDLREQFVAGIIVARGRGFDQTQTRSAFDPGFEAGIRSGVVIRGLWRLWIDAGFAFWPVPQELRVEGFENTVRAASFSGALALGGSFLSTR